MPKTVVFLTAHPDDCEFLAGGTVAKLVADGCDVYEILATGGDKGSFELDSRTLKETRDRETREAARILGKKGIEFLGYSDGQLGDTPINELREKYIRIIRKLRPDTVFTWDYWAPFEFHPDHRAVAQAAMEALSFSHFPLFHPEHVKEGLEPHLVADRYYFAKDTRLCDTVIDISEHIDRKIESLLAHDSQIKLILDEMVQNLKAMGADESILGKIDRSNSRPVLELMVKSHSAAMGSKAGYAFGEEFRHETAGGDLAKAVMAMLK